MTSFTSAPPDPCETKAAARQAPSRARILATRSCVVKAPRLPFRAPVQVDLRTPWWIGAVRIPTRLVLAPMAGVSVQAFRRQGRRFGAGLVCSEMVSCAGLQHGNERTLGYL